MLRRVSENPTEAAIRDYLLREILDGRGVRALTTDENLFDLGALDSLGILKTVSFLEEHFGVSIPDDQVLPENMESVRAIARLVERQRAHPA
jgi:acyl carrier protein